MKKVLKIVGGIVLVLLAIVLGAAAYVRLALPDTGEPEPITVERTPERIARGKYLANNVAVCMDCHSTRDWTLYAGPIAEGNFGGGGEVFNKEMGFPGNFYAPNITPHALGDWTDGELLRAITTGVNKEGKALFPVMGYHRFGQMDREDIYSIIAYLRTLDPVAKENPASEAEFPVNILINTMPQPANFQKIPAKSDQVAYGAYIANATGCVDCHSQMDKGKIIPGTEYGGGMEFAQPAGIIRSPNITMDMETGIGAWTEEAFVQRFRMYSDPAYKPARMGKTDLNTPMPWNMYAGMTDEDLKAIYAYLRSIGPIQHKVERYAKR